MIMIAITIAIANSSGIKEVTVGNVGCEGSRGVGDAVVEGRLKGIRTRQR